MSTLASHLESSADSLLEQARESMQNSVRSALPLATQALAQARRKADNPLVDDILAFRAQVWSLLKEGDCGLADAEEALEGYLIRGNERGQASVMNTLAIIKESTGHFTEAFRLKIECLKIVRKLDLPQGIAHVASNLGLSCTYVGDWDQALEFYQESLAAWVRLPPQEGKGHLLVNLGFAHASTHNWAEAEECYREALEIYGKKDPLHTSLVYANLARCHLDSGKIEEATVCSGIALELSEQQDDPAKKAHALNGQGAVLVKVGDLKGAEQAFSKALEIYASIPMPRGQAIALRELALLASQTPEKAATLLSEAQELAQKSGLKPVLVDILGDFHELCLKHEHWEKACHYLREKTQTEKALLKDSTALKLITLQMGMKLTQSQRETELERSRTIELTKALEDLQCEKKRAEEENRQKSEILNFAAHDLRNLLWGILGPAALIDSEREKIKDHPEIMDLVDAMMTSSQRLQETLHNVLNAAATESCSIQLSKQPTPLQPVLAKALDHWRASATAKDQSLHLQPGHEQLFAHVDPARISDCLHNLISNAIKYSPKRSSIQTGIQVTEKEIAFFVADEGPGLTEDDRRQMGRLFQRLSAKPTGNEVSMGVGLAIVKRFAELHGGRLEVNCPPAGGSVFRLVLPVD